MGVILSRFRGKKDTYQVLEDIDKKLTSLEKFTKLNRERRNKLIKRLLFTSVILYIIGALSIYFFFLPEEFHHRLYGSLPFLFFPLLVYFFKRFLHWYFVRKITQNELEMQDLQQQRKEILETVMEKETYKRAKEILEKFDPETKKKLEQEKKAKEEAERIAAIANTPEGLRKRNKAAPSNTSSTPRLNSKHNTNGLVPSSRIASPALPRPILPPTTSAMDKVLNYLVGDGVEQRYALICKNCYNHNGMAMKGEFEYMAYRCAYCRFFNPARKQRPNAPRLIDIIPNTPVPGKPPNGSSSDSESTPSTSDTKEPKKLEFETPENGITVLEDVNDLESKVGELKKDEEAISSNCYEADGNSGAIEAKQ